MVAEADDTNTVWHLDRIDGNIYRLKSARGDQFLQGDFKDDAPWLPVQTAQDEPEWGSQKFQFLRTPEDSFRIKCLWGDLFLSGRDVNDSAEKETNIRSAPLEPEWNSQKWKLVPVE